MFLLQLRHGGQLLLPRPGGEGLQSEGSGPHAGRAGVDTDQEVAGSRQARHCQPRGLGGDVPQDGLGVRVLHLELVGEFGLGGLVGPDGAGDSQRGEGLVVRVTVQHRGRGIFWKILIRWIPLKVCS